MTGPENAAQIGRFRAILARDLGWSFDGATTDHLAAVLARRTVARGLGTERYLSELDERAPHAMSSAS